VRWTPIDRAISRATKTYVARANDGSVPMAHHNVVAVFEPIRA